MIKPYQRALLDRFWVPPCGCAVGRDGIHREGCSQRRPRLDFRAVARMFGRNP